ncbi:MAG: neutral zinc metallopeptidase [Parvularculaceae bacterium]|nr:neutral zinc metallopeptidase [Parvularculaceae bacterium]
MVKWREWRKSDNVEDRRGAAAAGGLGLVLLLLRFVFSRWGLGGVAVLVAGYFALTAVGINPLSLLQGGPARSAPTSAEDQAAAEFVARTLGETEDVWTQKFQELGRRYEPPRLVMFTGQVNSACGMASAASGPFYCPADRQVYLDTSFFNELSQRFGAPGDFAATYVIAHEVGHHVQNLLGIADQVRQAQSAATSEAEGNALQVRMELQADCYAGVWAHATSRSLEPGDIEEGLRAAAAIGDDTLQRQAGRTVRPESFTHGSSQQRVEWFSRGYRSGAPADCDTFGAR